MKDTGDQTLKNIKFIFPPQLFLLFLNLLNKGPFLFPYTYTLLKRTTSLSISLDNSPNLQ